MTIPMEGTTVIVAIASVIIRPCNRGLRGHGWRVTQREIINDTLAGAAIVPFILILGSVFSPDLLRQAMTDKVIVSIGGFIGLISVLGDFFRFGELTPATETMPATRREP